ncbi:MAG: hypothetical protein ACODAJ_15440 [Planctomycetota bacterium]
MRSRLVNFLLLHDLSGPMAAKAADALMEQCSEGFCDHWAASLLNMALGEGSLVGTQGRVTAAATDKPEPDQTLKVKEWAHRVAVTAG